jgi:hypothetical protein
VVIVVIAVIVVIVVIVRMVIVVVLVVMVVKVGDGVGLTDNEYDDNDDGFVLTFAFSLSSLKAMLLFSFFSVPVLLGASIRTSSCARCSLLRSRTCVCVCVCVCMYVCVCMHVCV